MTPIVRKTVTKLADGRDLFYFDDTEPYVNGEKTRRLDDPRPLPDRFAPIPDPDNPGQTQEITGPQMRRDPLTGDWIPMASNRMNRTFLPPADANPLAPARPGAHYQDGEIPDTDYDVVVFENRFPSLMAVPNPRAGVEAAGMVDDNPLWRTRPADGRCEVICFGPRVDQNLVEMGPRRMRTVIEAWADRTAALSSLPAVRQVFCFENHGEDIGVTLSHPHGQIYAYPYLTPRTKQMLRQARKYRAANPGHNLLADILAGELEAGTRIIDRNEHWVLYTPAAARWPVEMHLAPVRDTPDLADLTEAERQALASIYLRMLTTANHFHLDPATGQPIALNYIAAWHQAPLGQGRDLLRLHLQFFSFLRAPGKLKYLAGSESGMAAWISDTTPEIIASRLRDARALAEEKGLFNGL